MDIQKDVNLDWKLERIKNLSPEKLALAQKLLNARKSGGSNSTVPIKPNTVKSGQNRYDMSFAQQRMWFVEQLNPFNSLYIEHGQLHFLGRTDVGLLEKTVNEVIKRHDSLRTTFKTYNEKPVQVISPELQIEIPVIDLEYLEPEMRLEEVKRLASIECREPFDLENGPLLRFKALRLSEEECFVFVTMHQIISDGWSVWLFTNEIIEVYKLLKDGKTVDLPLPKLQYTDYAAWQTSQIRDGKLQDLIGYWKNALEDCSPYLELPTDFSYSDVREQKGSTFEFSIPQDVSRRVEDLAKKHGVTSFVPIASALMLLFHRFNGQSNISIAVPVAGRNHSDLEQIIGFFVNILILKVNFEGDIDFNSLMKRVNTAAVGAYAHQDLPYEKLIENLNIDRSAARNPFFDILLNFNNLPQEALNLPELSITRTDLHEPVSKFPITVYVSKSKDRFEFKLLYQSELFSAARIETIGKQLAYLIENTACNPSLPLSDYSLIIPETTDLLPNPEEILDSPEYPQFTEEIRKRAKEIPEKISIEHSSQKTTYKELVDRAEKIAERLTRQGLQKGDGVCVQGGKSGGTIIAMLGIFFSGGVLLTLDKKLPVQRRKLMMSEANVKFIVSIIDDSEENIDVSDSTDILVSSHTGQIINSVENQPAANFSLPVIEGDDPAYIFFTSGTTSIPKGVVGSHKGLSHFLDWQKNTFEISSLDRCAHLTGLSFDVILREVFTPLISGATLCLPAEPEDLGRDEILPWLEAEKISIIHLTPTVAQSWLAGNEKSQPLPDLHAVFFAGEALTGSLVKQWRETFPGMFQIINLYGPTETTLAKCFYILPNSNEKLPPIIPVGRTLPFTQALVIRNGTKLCGSNELGEVVLRTPYKSKGYLKKETIRGKGFAKNFFRDSDDLDEIYWTGDLGRYRSDGVLEIVGRVDEQIKIRGIRIQPGEIISNLLEHPAVDACTVVVQNVSGRKILAAYIVSSKNKQAAASDLRAYLLQLLPGAFIPDVFVFLKSLPLTPNGKIDKKSLPQITQTEFESRSAAAAPRNAEEEKLAEIWKHELSLKQIGIHDNFFELGGHSLMAMKMMRETRQTFNLNLPLRLIFEAPTIAEFALSINRFLSEKGEVPANQNLAPVKIDLKNRYKPFPLTNIQQAYWIGRTGNFDLGQVATHNYSEYRFENLDVERFTKAFQRLIERHDALRLIITPEGQQRILKDVPAYKIPFRNLSHLDEKEKEEALKIVRENLSHKVHSLDQYPLFDTSISRITEESYIIHISVDALICDAWSRRLLGKELLQLYNSSKDLPSLDLSFRDYVLQEYEWQNSDEYLKSKTYWLNKLESLPPAPQLPLVKDPSLLKESHFVRWREKLSPDLWNKLKARAARSGLTPSGLICAVYAEILGLWSKNQRFTVNLTLFNRRQVHPQINNIVGDFTSLILLMIESDPEDTFETRAKRIQKQLFNDLDNSLFSGVEVLRELNRRAGGRTRALMPVVLTSTLFKSSEEDELLDIWQREMVYGISQTPQVYLDHGVSEQQGALIFGWDAIPELFEPGVIEEMFAAYGHLLRSLAADDRVWHEASRSWLIPPAQQARRRAFHLAGNAALEARTSAVSSTSPTTAAAVSEVLPTAAVSTVSDISGDLSYLHSGICLQALEQPAAAAVLSARRQLSFQQLCGEAALLAESLRAAGCRRGEIVGVLMEKGWEQVVAVLAILQAGGAYLPVDSRLPAARQAYLLENTGVTRLLTQPRLTAELRMQWSGGGRLAALGECRLSNEIAVWEVTAQAADSVEIVEAARRAARAVAAAQAEQTAAAAGAELAYVIYTSGSTGQPKGVRIGHAAALNTIAAINREFAVTGQDRVLGLSELSFDLSVYDIFGVLGAGGAIVLGSAESRRDPGEWQSLADEYGVSIWNSVPALMEMQTQWLEAGGGRLAERLRLVMLSGDWINVSLPERIRRVSRRADLEVVSLGGATEAGIWSILHRIGEVDESWRSIPYGRPLANQRIYVLNERGEEVPEEVTGELYIGGAGLAEGYQANEEQTRRRFIESRWGERLYRTGDLGKQRRAGWIEFAGREDTQVKVQGHRIELGEIESVLNEHGQVKQAVVTAVGEPGLPKRLVLYYVLQEKSDADQSELADFLREKLPEYMIPYRWIQIPEMPLSANGKVNRKELPDPDFKQDSGEIHTEAQNYIEEIIINILSHLLKVESLDRQDNFFFLGGDSVKGIQFLSELKKTLGFEIPLRVLFENPTIDGLAESVFQIRKQETGLSSALSRFTGDSELPLSFAQERIWFLCQLEPQNSFYQIPVMIRISGLPDHKILEKSLNTLINRHEMLKAAFPSVMGKAGQVISSEIEFKLDVIDGRRLSPGEFENIIEEEYRKPLDLSQAPLLRVKLIIKNDREHLLLLVIHHLISDAWSIETLVKEMAQIYISESKNEKPGLEPLTVQYVDFAAWQRNLLESGKLENQIAYWKERFNFLPPPLKLRNAHSPTSQSRTFDGGRESFEIEEILSKNIRELSKKENCTVFVTLLSAFYILLGFYSEQDDIIVNTSVSNRRGEEMNNIIGCFLNTLPLRQKLGSKKRFRDFMPLVRETAFGAFANQDLPFEELIKNILPEERQISYSPLSQIVFGLRNASFEKVEHNSLTFQTLELKRATAKFDLEMQIINRKKVLSGFLEYNRTLFDKTDAGNMVKVFQRILNYIVDDPNVTIEDIYSKLSQTELEELLLKEAERKNLRRKKFKEIKPVPVVLHTVNDINTSTFDSPNKILFVVESNNGANLGEWINSNRQLIKSRILDHGAVLFRGFDVKNAADFEKYVQLITPDLLEYTERSTPRETIQGKVYTATNYPADQKIPLHNENSYSNNYPRMLWFYCHQPAEVGGETPLADSKKVYELIPADIREKMVEKGVLYVRNNHKRLGLGWEEVFGTSEPHIVEKYCQANDIDFEWIEEKDHKKHLRTKQLRPAIERHPETGELVWFNQAHLFHISSLKPDVRESLEKLVAESDLPRNAYYGDGERIEAETLEIISNAYDQAKIVFPWQKGDVLLLDNMLVAHGRLPFQGNREVMVMLVRSLAI